MGNNINGVDGQIPESVHIQLLSSIIPRLVHHQCLHFFFIYNINFL